MSINYTVSVRLMTFNHAPFIREAIESILMQKTNFFVEVVVGDDFSTDSTLDILKQYESTENIHIKILERRIGDQYWQKRQRHGRFYNFYNILENCNGKYIALLDGDDYWTDPLKLQKQIDFLEKNNSYILTCGGYEANHNKNNKIIIKKGGFNSIDETERGFTFSLETEGWLTKTLTAVFKNKPNVFVKLLQYNHCRDIHLFYHLLKEGKGYYFKEVFGVYNIHEGGINSLKHGIINKTAYYNSSKEIYSFNKEPYTRKKALKATLSLFNYNLYNNHDDNNLKNNTKLLLESLKYIRSHEDLRILVNSFIPEYFKEKFKSKKTLLIKTFEK